MSQKMSLNQVLAPQLQQSLNLLQAPMLELKAMIDQELQANPVLEEQAALDMDAREQGETDEAEEAKVDLAEPPSDTQYDPTDESNAGEPVDDFQKEINQLLELDQDWRDHFSSTNLPSRNSRDEDEKRQFMLDSVTTAQSLQDFLLEQARLSSPTTLGPCFSEERRGVDLARGEPRRFLTSVADTTGLLIRGEFRNLLYARERCWGSLLIFHT